LCGGILAQLARLYVNEVLPEPFAFDTGVVLLRLSQGKASVKRS